MASKKIQKVFRDIENFAKLRGFSGKKTKKAIDWYKEEISKLKNINKLDVLASNKKHQRKRFKPGTMALYFYSPKHKDTLPYYDTFPCTIFIEPTKDGFYGLNMHYLPPVMRAKLLHQLYKFNTGNKFKLSYDLLKGLSNTMWKPAFKRYLNKQVKSNFIIVPEESMNAAVFLPVSNFKKASTSAVWTDSRKKAKE